MDGGIARHNTTVFLPAYDVANPSGRLLPTYLCQISRYRAETETVSDTTGSNPEIFKDKGQ